MIYIRPKTYSSFCHPWIMGCNQHPSGYKAKASEGNLGRALSADPGLPLIFTYSNHHIHLIKRYFSSCLQSSLDPFCTSSSISFRSQSLIAEPVPFSPPPELTFRNTGWGKRGFTVVSTHNAVYFCMIIYCIICPKLTFMVPSSAQT